MISERLFLKETRVCGYRISITSLRYPIFLSTASRSPISASIAYTITPTCSTSWGKERRHYGLSAMRPSIRWTRTHVPWKRSFPMIPHTWDYLLSAWTIPAISGSAPSAMGLLSSTPTPRTSSRWKMYCSRTSTPSTAFAMTTGMCGWELTTVCFAIT